MSFVKLHGSILDSSVWGLSHPTRIVWLTMLAMADEHGVVSASVDGLARRAVVTIEECQHALASFLGPDPMSRDGGTGERIEKVPGGWLVLNHANYRDRQTRQQILTAARVAKHRKKAARDCGVTGNDVTPHLQTSPSEAEAEAEADSRSREASQLASAVPATGADPRDARTLESAHDLVNRVVKARRVP